MPVRPCTLPATALLLRYSSQRMSGAYTDCFAVEAMGHISHTRFVEAFYTSWLFKIERMILRFVMARPSTDVQAGQLAAGLTDRFSAWSVEDRTPDQLLMADMMGRTRSWLMVEKCAVDANGQAAATRLLFGSAVVPAQNRSDAPQRLGYVFHALLWFHQIYSRLLLGAALRNL